LTDKAKFDILIIESKTKIKMNNLRFAKVNGFELLSWKNYNQIKKKAMEQEFSWSGLFLSCFIAFFIVVLCALSLNFVQKEISKKANISQNQSKLSAFNLVC